MATRPRRHAARGKSLPKEVRDLTKQEVNDVRKMFVRFDKNRDGHISVSELALILQLLGNNPTEEQVQLIIADADKNGNGCLEYGEFLALMSCHLKPLEEEELELYEAFKVFDKDNDNYIDAQEIRSVMRATGLPLTDRQIDVIFQKADLDGDGRIDYTEFVKLMTGNAVKG